MDPAALFTASTPTEEASGLQTLDPSTFAHYWTHRQFRNTFLQYFLHRRWNLHHQPRPSPPPDANHCPVLSLSRLEEQPKAAQAVDKHLSTLHEIIQQSPLSIELMEILHEQLHNEKDPSVRRNGLKWYWQWLEKSKKRTPTLLTSKELEWVKRMIFIVVKDVWSAIRKEIAEMEKVIQYFPLSFLSELIKDLLETCRVEKDKHNWKIQEGAYLGLAVIFRSIKVQTKTIEGSPPVSTFYLKQMPLPQLPECDQVVFKATIFDAMLSSQLTVREYATIALKEYCRLSSLQFLQLCFRTALDQLTTTIAPAHTAEGVLGIIQMLIEKLGLMFLQENWIKVSSTLMQYVGHSASTVRQKCSLVIKAVITKPGLFESSPGFVESIFATLIETKATEISPWEYREGQLFVAEVLLQELQSRLFRHYKINLYDTISHRAPNVDGIGVLKSPLHFNELHYQEENVHGYGQYSLPDDNSSETLDPECYPRLLQVLRIWFEQAEACFMSDQFELIRISTQILPNLLLSIVSSSSVVILQDWADRRPQENEKSGHFYSLVVYSMFLHNRRFRQYLHQTTSALPLAFDTGLQQAKSMFSTQWDQLVQVTKHATIKDSVVANLNAMMLMLIELAGDKQDFTIQERLCIPIQQITRVQQQMVLQDTTASPEQFPVFVKPRNIDVALSANLVVLLPNFIHLAQNKGDMDGLLPVILNWLKSKDDRRWITLNKHEAQLMLLDSLVVFFDGMEASSSAYSTAMDYANKFCQLFANLIQEKTLSHRSYVKMLNLVILFLARGFCAADSFNKVLSVLMDQFQKIKAAESRTPTQFDERIGSCTSDDEWDDWDEEDDTAEVNDAEESNVLMQIVNFVQMSKSFPAFIESISSLPQVTQQLVQALSEA